MEFFFWHLASFSYETGVKNPLSKFMMLCFKAYPTLGESNSNLGIFLELTSPASQTSKFKYNELKYPSSVSGT